MLLSCTSCVRCFTWLGPSSSLALCQLHCLFFCSMLSSWKNGKTATQSGQNTRQAYSPILILLRQQAAGASSRKQKAAKRHSTAALHARAHLMQRCCLTVSAISSTLGMPQLLSNKASCSRKCACGLQVMKKIGQSGGCSQVVTVEGCGMHQERFFMLLQV
jgi:hypothetical protein